MIKIKLGQGGINIDTVVFLYPAGKLKQTNSSKLKFLTEKDVMYTPKIFCAIVCLNSCFRILLEF